MQTIFLNEAQNEISENNYYISETDSVLKYKHECCFYFQEYVVVVVIQMLHQLTPSPFRSNPKQMYS